ncbi:MAG: hypothetical protein HN757_12130, partial [Calditrichaeota bacterium]|nr:hypothetical protein [Calditrichota bacterium]
MKPISTARTAFYTIFFVVIILTLTASAAPRDNLPEIDLPDFVISGVEQATLVRGDRLSYNALSPEITTPDILISSRPEMSTHSVNIIQSRPEVDVGPDRDFKFVDMYAGNVFGFGLKHGMGFDYRESVITGMLWLNSPPRLYEFGEGANMGVKLGANVKIPQDVILKFSSEYSSTQFNLPDRYMWGEIDNEWRDMTLSGSFTPLTTSIGSFSGQYKFNHWSLNEFDNQPASQISANQSRFSLRHETSGFNGQFETVVEGIFEPLDQDSKNLTLLKGKVNFGWWEPTATSVRIGFGLNVYSGTSSGTGDISGVQPNVKTIWNPTFGGLVFLKWNPDVNGHSLRSTMRSFPMLGGSNRSS